MTSRKYRFVGRVQGVGFRYTSQRIAVGLSLRGYVRNLADGSVEMVAQGPPASLAACLEGIRDSFGEYIREVTVTDLPSNARYGDFSITY
jgi:acylphosphatase